MEVLMGMFKNLLPESIHESPNSDDGPWRGRWVVSDWNVILVSSAFKMWSMVDYPFQKMFTNVYTATPSAPAPAKLPRQQRADKHLKEQII